MIVWGGGMTTAGDLEVFGGVYSPGTNSWTLVNTNLAPSPRYRHTAVEPAPR